MLKVRVFVPLAIVLDAGRVITLPPLFAVRVIGSSIPVFASSVRVAETFEPPV